MSRYIDADLLQEDFKEDHGGKRSLMIDTQPTADVVEVVRCKNCKYYNEYENGEKIIGEEEVNDGWCMRWSGIEDVNRRDYCSYGERAARYD